MGCFPNRLCLSVCVGLCEYWQLHNTASDTGLFIKRMKTITAKAGVLIRNITCRNNVSPRQKRKKEDWLKKLPQFVLINSWCQHKKYWSQYQGLQDCHATVFSFYVTLEPFSMYFITKTLIIVGALLLHNSLQINVALDVLCMMEGFLLCAQKHNRAFNAAVRFLFSDAGAAVLIISVSHLQLSTCHHLQVLWGQETKLCRCLRLLL